MSDRSELLRRLPSVDRILGTPAAMAAVARLQRTFVVESVRTVVEDVRRSLTSGAVDTVPSPEALFAMALERLEAGLTLRPVVNATGVVLHTNLGRALLADEAVDAVAAVAAQAANLEYDVARGERGERDDLIRADLCALTGAEDATVVNNNAAAVLLVLNSLAEGREVIVSRGELIEIGGSFRIPDVMSKSQALLREVGTTNRTHRRDYENALCERTGLLLKVHTSNYRIVGFTSEVGLDALVSIGHAHDVPVMEDLGSGALVDLSAFGLPKEPVVSERIALGADVVTFSGDKLLGGPQAGLIVGRRALIEQINRNPLKRALRCDKLTLAALAATLRLYRTAPDLPRALPTLRWLTRSLAEMEAVGERAVGLLREVLGPAYRVDLVDTQSEIGSGALPVEALPSRAVAIMHATEGPDHLARRFRSANPPIIGRIHEGRLLLDLRGIFDARELVPSTA